MQGIAGMPVEIPQGFDKVSQAQQEMLASAPAEMRPFLSAQMKMEKEQELSELITRMMKSDHEQAMTQIKNIGG